MDRSREKENRADAVEGMSIVSLRLRERRRADRVYVLFSSYFEARHVAEPDITIRGGGACILQRVSMHARMRRAEKKTIF